VARKARWGKSEESGVVEHVREREKERLIIVIGRN
jgi:hypothetical protein